jgi:hypothetical protein
VGTTFPREAWAEEYKQLCVDLRNACLNELYYKGVADRASNWNTGFEIIIALFASGSAISAWNVWRTASGQSAWAILAGLATVAAYLKPILRHAERAKTATSLHTGFKGLHLELEDLWRDLKLKRAIETADRNRRKSILERTRKLEVLEIQTGSEDRELKRTCADEVKRRYPPQELWIPEFAGGTEHAERPTTS